MSYTIGNYPNQSERISYHSIVTDNPFMAQLGLTCFTLDDLIEWLSRKNSAGEYSNIGLLVPGGFYKITSNPTIPYDAAAIILNNGADYNLQSWKNNEDGTGQYVNYTVKLKTISQSSSSFWWHDRYIFNTMNLDRFFNKKVVFSNGSFELQSANQGFFGVSISQIIEANNWIRGLIATIPKNSWTEEDRALYEFITDIKSSLGGYLSWKSNITFSLKIEDQTCSKQEQVEFKLYLYDDKIQRSSARKVAVSNYTIVGPKLDAAGRAGNLQNGVVSAPGINSINSEVAGDLSVTWNDFEKKWESGSTQMIAILETDINPVSYADLLDILSLDIKSLLASSKMPVLGTGKAIPIVMHNSNPKQWGPTYKAIRECDVINNEKFSVTVFNFSNREYKAGDKVKITKISGIWIVSPLDSTANRPIEVSDESWEFMYFVTNSDFYFLTKGGTRFTFNEFEQSFRSLYYDLDPLNGTNISKKWLDIGNGFVQMTSWDFMGKNIGGLREKNSIGGTIYGQFIDGVDAIENDAAFENFYVYGSFSAPFFGCVFPDGYKSDQVIIARDKYNNANHSQLIPTGDINFVDGEYQYIRPVASDLPLFEDNNANVTQSTNYGGIGGLFSKVTTGEDVLLKHLPADIATNGASSPIRSMLDYNLFTSSRSPDSVSLRNNIESFFKTPGKVWLVDSESKEDVFNLKPVNRFKLQFRPIRAEVYASFEHDNYASASSYENNKRGEFGAIPWITYISDQSAPISDKVLERTLYNGQLSPLKGSFGLKYNIDNDPRYIPSSNSKYNIRVWNRDWMADAPAGAVGVITAKTSISANSSITFTTNSFIGMWSAPVGLSPTTWYPSFGGFNGDLYNTFNITHLFARIYESWPKDQTIFDPRTYSVFHFNPGANAEPDETVSVDLKIPTNKNNSLIPLGVFIYKNSDIQPASLWLNDTSRRGKLLPYSYLYNTIGVSDGDAFISGFTTPGNSTDFAFYIQQQGIGYKQTDTFTTSGGSGRDVVLNPIVGQDGRISGFTVAKNGYGFIPEDFSETGINLDQSFFESLSVNIAPLNVSGLGFSGSVIRGKIVKTPIMVDSGPSKVGEDFYRLTPPTPIATIDSNQQPSQEKIITTVLVSKPGVYDVFLHYHNDISHVLGKQWGGQNAPENHVTLEISTS